MAANTRDIRRRIKSVKNTAQITKAMQMVASSKMRKAQLAALAGRRFAALMNQVIVAAGKSSQDFAHPLMEQRPVRKRGVLVVSTDKGLCGALNTNLGREAAKFDKDATKSRQPHDAAWPRANERITLRVGGTHYVFAQVCFAGFGPRHGLGRFGSTGLRSGDFHAVQGNRLSD